MVWRGHCRLMRPEALLAVAALGVAVALAADGGGECLASSAPEGGGRAPACSEEDVESAEEALMHGANVELLQLGVRVQAQNAPAAARRRSEGLEVDKLAVGEVNWGEREKELLDRLEDEDRSIAALQELVTSQDQTIELLLNERHNQAATASSSVASSAVDCVKYPMFCDKRINCAAKPLGAKETAAINKRIATPDGHANPRSWCVAYPLYATSLQKCVLERDPSSYAREMFASQTEMKLLDADAIYCFVSGHCNNTNVDLTTTQEQAEGFCDQRYGHSSWTKVGMDDFKAVLARAKQWGSGRGVPKEWKHKSWSDIMAIAKREARVSAMTSCAMGNYHCDVFYCRTNFCEDPTYRSKWGNLSWTR